MSLRDPGAKGSFSVLKRSWQRHTLKAKDMLWKKVVVAGLISQRRFMAFLGVKLYQKY